MKISKEKLEIAMADQGILFKDLAELANISRVSLGHYYSGETEPRPAAVGKIAKALGVSVTDIIEFTNDDK